MDGGAGPRAAPPAAGAAAGLLATRPESRAMRRAGTAALALATALLGAARDAPGEDPAAPPQAPGTERLGSALDEIGKHNPVLATVNGQEIRWADIVESARDLPEEYRSQIETIFPALLQRLIDMRLIVWAGREAGLAEDAEVRRRVRRFEDRVISDVYVRREVADKVTTPVLRARYDAYLKELAARTQVRARHILLASEDAARQVIAELDGGADFAELARERSSGPSAEQGGDLDYFTRGGMTPALSDAAFAMEVGEHSRTPVKTEFGWHVIKVEDRREPQPASFFRMRDRLREEITRRLMDEMLRELREAADIELYPQARAR